MKSVCLKCNRPLELHKKYTAEFVEAVRGATYHAPILGHYAPIGAGSIGQYMGHDPMMSTKEPTWPTPFGTTEIPLKSPDARRQVTVGAARLAIAPEINNSTQQTYASNPD